ncbi:MAG: helix-turn-helix transcriptional regulator [Firmicutes bacterium]|nr:helix-turn-helix transcriptional regulator [Bacillota bacterium]
MEASYECGFTNYSSFVKAFKKFYEFSPRQYIQNRRHIC